MGGRGVTSAAVPTGRFTSCMLGPTACYQLLTVLVANSSAVPRFSPTPLTSYLHGRQGGGHASHLPPASGDHAAQSHALTAITPGQHRPSPQVRPHLSIARKSSGEMKRV